MVEEKEKPLTRGDVLRLIEENGGTADGLDLSGKVFEEGVDLQGIELRGIVLNKASLVSAHLKFVNLKGAHLAEAALHNAQLERADLSYAHLERANLENANLNGAILPDAYLEDALLRSAHLEAAILDGSHLERANLNNANLDWASLRDAHLEGSCLSEAIFSRNTSLERVDWGNYVLAEEREGWFIMSDSYRRLKTWYSDAGMYEVAGEFFFREMTARRKMLKWWSNPFPRAWSKLLSLICGYGERPLRVVGWAASVIFGLAAAYYFWGSFSSSSFWDTLYYSAASFTALGYGQWAPQPTGWAKGMGAAEAIIGVFMMALFLITFTRKMTR